MKIDNIKSIILECLNDVIFEYNGKKSGITSEVHNYVPVFQVWHGTKTKEYENVDELLNDKFYSGKSIIDLIEKIEFTFA